MTKVQMFEFSTSGQDERWSPLRTSPADWLSHALLVPHD